MTTEGRHRMGKRIITRTRHEMRNLMRLQQKVPTTGDSGSGDARRWFLGIMMLDNLPSISQLLMMQHLSLLQLSLLLIVRVVEIVHIDANISSGRFVAAAAAELRWFRRPGAIIIIISSSSGASFSHHHPHPIASAANG